jgi:hypothetical protein
VTEEITSANNTFISIEDIDSQKFFVVISKDFNQKVIDSLIKKYKNLNKASLNFNFSNTSLYYWKRKNQYPLKYLIDILTDIKYNRNLLNKYTLEIKSGFNLENNGGGISKSIYPKLPIKISKNLMRIISHIMGDGCLSYKNGSVSLAYYNQNNILIEKFKDDVRYVFGDIGIYENINKSTNFVKLPSPIAYLLLDKINTFNSKTCLVPEFIKKSDKNTKKEFLKSFFDDEGHVCYNPPHRYIELSLCNKNLLNQIKELINELGIETTKVYNKQQGKYHVFTFYIKHFHNLEKFSKNIGFYHDQKLSKLNKLLKSPGRKSYSIGETKKLILNVLKKNHSTSTELKNLLKRDRSTINYWLSLLNKEDKIYKRARRVLKKGTEIIWSIK